MAVSEEDLREETSWTKTMSQIIENEEYLSDEDAVEGQREFSHYADSDTEEPEYLTVSDVLENPKEYLKRNPGQGLSAREIAEDIIDPDQSEYIAKSIRKYVKEHGEESFLSDKEMQEIEEERREEFEQKKEEIESRYERKKKKERGLIETLFGKSDRDLKEEKEKEIERARPKPWQEQEEYEQARENARDFFNNMTEEQQREFVIDRIAEEMDEKLSRERENNELGPFEGEDEKGFERYVFHED